MSYTLAYTGAEIDALLGKIDAIFVAEYGSTIYSEVTAAIAAGNKVIVANAGKVYVYAGQDDNGGYVFTQSGPNAAKPNATYVTLSTGNVWSTATVDLATLQQFYASLMEDTASGSIASFPDGAENVPVKELTAEIEPIQDLHSYSNPWPAGGGKNLIGAAGGWNGSGVLEPNAQAVRSEKIAVTQGDTFIASKAQAFSATYAAIYVLEFDSADAFIRQANILAYSTLSGGAYTVGAGVAKVAFSVYFNNADAGNIASIKPQVEKGSTITDFVPYSNICPIEGYTGAEITRDGVNLFDKTTVTDNTAVRGTNGTTSGNNNYYATDYIRVLGGESYYINITNKNSSAFGFAWYDENKTFISGWYGPSAGDDNVIIGARTAPANAKYLRVSIYKNYNSLDAIGVNYPSTDTSYHAYNGTTYSIDWTDEAGTVYGGYIEYLGGDNWRLWQTMAGNTFANLSWQTYSSGGVTAFYTNTGGRIASNGDIDSMTSSYPTLSARSRSSYMSNGADDTACHVTDSSAVYIKDATYNGDLNAWLAAMGSQTLVWTLLAPVSYDLTAEQLTTLLGDNVIWSDTGDISVKYRANTALYIEKKLGE